jgi:hypothetical protein
MVRLRQAVLAARDLDTVAGALRSSLGLGEPFHDPAVGHFGLRNAVMALGDTFVEVVSPEQDGTAAGRFLDRRGTDSAGYMLMFQLDDLASARERVKALGVRTVFSVDLDDIADDHLHPRDMGGAIVALDRPSPAGSWRWGGPAWEARVPQFEPGGVRGATVRAADPVAMASRWAEVLGLPVHDDAIAVDGGTVQFIPAGDESEGLAGVALEASGRSDSVDIGGVTFTFVRPR